jgi:hypothetical protein
VRERERERETVWQHFTSSEMKRKRREEKRREEKNEVILGGFNNQNSKNKRVKTITRFLYLVPVSSQKKKNK